MPQLIVTELINRVPQNCDVCGGAFKTRPVCIWRDLLPVICCQSCSAKIARLELNRHERVGLKVSVKGRHKNR
jgi:hypothetical protein